VNARYAGDSLDMADVPHKRRLRLPGQRECIPVRSVLDEVTLGGPPPPARLWSDRALPRSFPTRPRGLYGTRAAGERFISDTSEDPTLG
jgi:hypothetical protein